MNEVLRGASDRDNGQMSMSTDQRFAAVGSWVLILWGIGHNVVIDILPLVFGVYLYDVDSTVLALMRQSILRFPLTGQTTAYLAFYGLSVWLGIKAALVGDTTQTPGRQDDDEFTRRARLSWAKLIRRVYEVDPLLCPFCGAEMKILAFIVDFGAAKPIRKSLGLPPKSPNRWPERLRRVWSSTPTSPVTLPSRYLGKLLGEAGEDRGQGLGQ